MDALFAVLIGLCIVPVSALQCNSTYTWYKWANNFNDEDPCQVLSHLRASCAPNAHPLQPLSYDPHGMNHYPGPHSSSQNICMCSYVVYNLMAACGDCQVGILARTSLPTYRTWTQSCSKSNKGGSYPDAIPPNFLDSIPKWARVSLGKNDDSRWSYSLSHALASRHAVVNSDSVALASTPSCPPHSSPPYALPVGTAFAGFGAGFFTALLGLFLQRKCRAHVIPPPTRYHTAPDNTPLPLLPRTAYAHGSNFLRRMLQSDQQNDPHRIEPFDISTAVGMQAFPPHPAVFPSRRLHTFPPTTSASALNQISSQAPSRQPSFASLNHTTFSAHHATPSQSKTTSRPHTSHSFLLPAESPIAGPSRLSSHHDLSPSSPSNPLPPDPTSSDAPADPPAYRRKS